MNKPRFTFLIILLVAAITSAGCSGVVNLNPTAEKLCENHEETLVILKSIVDIPSSQKGAKQLADLEKEYNVMEKSLREATFGMYRNGIEPDFSRFDEFMIRFADTDSKCREELKRMVKIDFSWAGDGPDNASGVIYRAAQRSNPFREAP